MAAHSQRLGRRLTPDPGDAYRRRHQWPREGIGGETEPPWVVSCAGCDWGPYDHDTRSAAEQAYRDHLTGGDDG